MMMDEEDCLCHILYNTLTHLLSELQKKCLLPAGVTSLGNVTCDCSAYVQVCPFLYVYLYSCRLNYAWAQRSVSIFPHILAVCIPLYLNDASYTATRTGINGIIQPKQFLYLLILYPKPYAVIFTWNTKILNTKAHNKAIVFLNNLFFSSLQKCSNLHFISDRLQYADVLFQGTDKINNCSIQQ